MHEISLSSYITVKIDGDFGPAQTWSTYAKLTFKFAQLLDIKGMENKAIYLK